MMNEANPEEDFNYRLDQTLKYVKQLKLKLWKKQNIKTTKIIISRKSGY